MRPTAATIRTIATAAMLLWAGIAGAQTGQYYLTAFQAPQGSITQAGQANRVVYLRWDVLEGELPADVTRLQLKRNGATLLDQAVTDVMSPAQIDALYRGPAQERRLLETLLNLKENAIADDRDFSPSNFADVIHEYIDPLGAGFEEGWTFLASKNDINVARARYRAYVDDPGTGLFQYELLAVDADDNTARLGYVEVDTTNPQQLLPAGDFAQLPPARCDLPEMARDHYTVALNWNAPGVTNIADRLAAQVYLAGYDLYRTTDNLDGTVVTPPARDIAQEAAVAGHDTRGVPQIAGLEKVNTTLLTITADGSPTPEWLETQDDLALAGLEPGDKRAYYLVPRDFTGNYGPTSATIVVVPNLIRPPAPWDVRPVVRDNISLNAALPNLTFSFDAVDLPNYLDAFRDQRSYCNLFEAETSGILEFVGPGEACDADPHRSVRLDVSDYVIYRFLDFDTASKFRDSDGDGVSDVDERAGATQCNAGAQPPGAVDHRLPPAAADLTEVVLPESGKVTWRFKDEAPAFVKDEVLWYRVASRTPDGRLSLLSAPQRAIFPDRQLPEKPVINARRPGTVVTGCDLAVDGSIGTWLLDDEIDGSPFEVDCAGLKEPLLVSGKSVGADGPTCERIRDYCNTDPITLTYPDRNNPDTALCTVNLPADLGPDEQGFGFCETGQARLVPVYGEGEIPVEPGEVVTGPLNVSVTLADGAFPDVCFDLYENIDGDVTRVGSSCDTATPEQLDYEAISGFFCGYAVARDDNNNVSPAASVPCTFILPDSPKAPAKPQPVSFAVGTDRADLSWRLPIEPVTVTLVSLEHTPGDGTRTRELISVPSPGSGSGDIVRHTANIPPLDGNADEFCVRFQAIGPDTANEDANASGWSAPLCQTRRAQGSVLPQYLPWPIVDGAVEGTPLAPEVFTATFSSGGSLGLLYVDLAPIPDLDIKTYSNSCGLSGTADGPPNTDLFSTEIWCNDIGRLNATGVIDAITPFLAYRQSRSPAGERSDWIQVSPLIEFAHWDSIPVVPNTDFDRELNDPYIKLVANPNAQTGWRFVFRDNYTYLPGWEYRYQFVYFDDDHRITRWRRSDWITFTTESL